MVAHTARGISLVATLAAAAFLVLAAPPIVQPALEAAEAACRDANTRPADLRPKEARKAVACLIDARRAERGKPGLDSKGTTREAALRHSRRMLKADCFAHRCPGEPDLEGRLRASSYLPCNCTWLVGENLGWGERGRERQPRLSTPG